MLVAQNCIPKIPKRSYERINCKLCTYVSEQLLDVAVEWLNRVH